ncbi:hypothetical protein K4A83_22700, partial [Spirulina subsalsa FACHB-351]
PSCDLDPLAPFDPPEALEDPEFLGGLTNVPDEDIFTLDPLELTADPFNSSELWDDEETPLEDSFESVSESAFNSEIEETFDPQEPIQPQLNQELNPTVISDNLNREHQDLDPQSVNPNSLNQELENQPIQNPELTSQPASHPSIIDPDLNPTEPQSEDSLEMIFSDQEDFLDPLEDDFDYSLDLSEYSPDLELENDPENNLIFPENIAPIKPVEPEPKITNDFVAPIFPEENGIDFSTFPPEAEEIAPLIDFSNEETSPILDPDDFQPKQNLASENFDNNFTNFDFTETAPQQPTEDLYSDLEWTDPAAEMADEQPLDSLPETTPSLQEQEEELDYGQTSSEEAKELNSTQETSLGLQQPSPSTSPKIDTEKPDNILFGDDWNNNEQLDTVPSIEDTFGRLELEQSLAEFDADELFLVESEPEPTPEPSQTPQTAPLTPPQPTIQKAPS